MSLDSAVHSLYTAMMETKTYLPNTPKKGFHGANHDCGINVPKQDGTPYDFIPDASQLSAHDKVALKICEKNAVQSLAEIQTILNATPGGTCWAPELYLLRSKDTFTLGTVQNKKAISRIYSKGELLSVLKLLALILMMGKKGPTLYWTYGNDPVVFGAADLGSATALGMILCDPDHAQRVLSGDGTPQHVSQYFSPKEAHQALKNTKALLT